MGKTLYAPLLEVFTEMNQLHPKVLRFAPKTFGWKLAGGWIRSEVERLRLVLKSKIAHILHHEFKFGILIIF